MGSNEKDDGASTKSPVNDYNSADMDTAFNYIQNAGNNSGSLVSEKELLRKIDWRIVPIMFACYTMQFVDKILINVSPLFLEQKQMFRSYI